MRSDISTSGVNIPVIVTGLTTATSVPLTGAVTGLSVSDTLDLGCDVPVGDTVDVSRGVLVGVAMGERVAVSVAVAGVATLDMVSVRAAI